MAKLPKIFPEYLVMYKTLTKKIQDLENEKDKAKEEKTINDIQKKLIKLKMKLKKLRINFQKNF